MFMLSWATGFSDEPSVLLPAGPDNAGMALARRLLRDSTEMLLANSCTGVVVVHYTLRLYAAFKYAADAGERALQGLVRLQLLRHPDARLRHRLYAHASRVMAEFL